MTTSYYYTIIRKLWLHMIELLKNNRNSTPSSKKETIMSQQTVKPEGVSGTRDLLPQDAITLDRLISKIRAVYESFGFVPLDTPCLEKWGVLTGNEPTNKSLYRAKIVRGIEDKGVSSEELASDDSALRFDLTVPLARVVSANPDLPRPFKRYQIGKVFRGERAQAARQREFTQFDFDIVGSASIVADVEVIQIMYTTMRSLGVPRFLIRFNTRKVLNGLAEMVGSGEKSTELFRIIDKSDKVSVEEILTELQRKPDNEFDESALHLSDDQANVVRKFLELRGADTESTLQKLEELINSAPSEIAKEGLEELKTIANMLRHLGIPEDFWAVDLSVARGLDYYTGPVFETILPDMPELGSVFSGGRYDGLVNRFMPGSNLPAVGASVGIDRMLSALQKFDLLPPISTMTTVLVSIFNPKLAADSLLLAKELREAGLNAEIYLGNDSMLRAQITYAIKQDIPFMVILGPDELAKGQVQLKNLRAKSQSFLSRKECIELIKNTISVTE